MPPDVRTEARSPIDCSTHRDHAGGAIYPVPFPPSFPEADSWAQKSPRHIKITPKCETPRRAWGRAQASECEQGKRLGTGTPRTVQPAQVGVECWRDHLERTHLEDLVFMKGDPRLEVPSNDLPR